MVVCSALFMWELLRSAGQQLTTITPQYAVAALLVYVLSVVVAGARWREIVIGLGHPIRLRDTCAANLGSIFVNNITPGRIGGEVFRLAVLNRSAGIPLPRAGASLAYDRLTDVVPLVLMVVLALPTLRRVAGPGTGRLLLWGTLAVVLIVIAVWLAKRGSRLRASLARLLELRVPAAVLGRAALYSLLLWSLDLVRLWLVAKAVRVSLSPLDVIPLSIITVLGGMLSIGGLGAVEGGLVGALMLYGVSADRALAVSLLERSISYLLATAAGGVVVLALGGRSFLASLKKRKSAAPT
jgi:uncharacterized membrane protein YbhN (UPF0104 family)